MKVTDQITNLVIEGCGTFNSRPWTHSFTWQNSSQPTSGQVSRLDEATQAASSALPSVEVFYTP